MDRDQDIELMKTVARSAGDIALSYFGCDPEVWHKAGGSPVSEADLAVDDHLREHLVAARPAYGWLSEESDGVRPQIDTGAVFVVDPIDGTRGFLAGDPRWSISLAVVMAGRPVSAVLYLPAAQKLFWAGAGAGAWLDGRTLGISPRADLSGARLAGPSKWTKSPEFSALNIARPDYIPSLAYRLALVAESAIDGAVAKPGSHDWDLAAADLLVHEAGGRLTGLDGRALRYNRSSLRHGLLVAAREPIHRQLIELVRQIAEDSDGE